MFRLSGRLHIFIAVVLINVLVSACGTKRKLDEMHDATVNMDKKTTELGDNTRKLVAKTDKLDAKTAEMYDALKQGDSLNARRLGLAGILEAYSIAAKVSEAGKYIMSFEYQVWSGLGLDTEEKRVEVASSGVREFMKDVQEFIPDPENLVAVPLVRGADDSANRLRGLNAISVAMHLINPKQEHILKVHPTLKEISMMGMIQEALRARPLIDQGTKRIEDYPPYVKDVLVYEAIAQLLIQTRYNFLGAMTLARVKAKSELRKTGLKAEANKWKNMLLSFAQAFVDVPNVLNLSTSMNVDLAKFNLVEVREFSRYLKAALKVSEFLNSIGVPPKIDVQLLEFYKGLDVKMSAIQAKPEQPDKISEKILAEVELVDLINRYRESGEKGLTEVATPPPSSVLGGSTSTTPTAPSVSSTRKASGFSGELADSFETEVVSEEATAAAVASATETSDSGQTSAAGLSAGSAEAASPVGLGVLLSRAWNSFWVWWERK